MHGEFGRITGQTEGDGRYYVIPDASEHGDNNGEGWHWAASDLEPYPNEAVDMGITFGITAWAIKCATCDNAACVHDYLCKACRG